MILALRCSELEIEQDVEGLTTEMSASLLKEWEKHAFRSYLLINWLLLPSHLRSGVQTSD